MGVDCIEFEVERGDTPEQVVEVLRENSTEYYVVKVPTGMADIGFAVQQEGFQYIETAFRITRKIEPSMQMPEMCKKFEKDVGWKIATAEEADEILEIVKTGEVFTTDRVAIDPAFSPQKAGERYAMWMRDVIESPDGVMIVMTYQGKPIGFSTAKIRGKTCDGILGGLLPEYLESGYGFLLDCAHFQWLQTTGCTRIVSGVSSNNIPIMKMHLMFGYSIQKAFAVYVKHR